MALAMLRCRVVNECLEVTVGNLAGCFSSVQCYSLVDSCLPVANLNLHSVARVKEACWPSEKDVRT